MFNSIIVDIVVSWVSLIKSKLVIQTVFIYIFAITAVFATVLADNEDTVTNI